MSQPERERRPNGGKLSASDLLKNIRESQFELESKSMGKRKLTVAELLERKQPDWEKGLKKDQDGLER